MSRNGMPSFGEIYAAYREQDPDKRTLAFAVIDVKRQGAIMRSQARKARLSSIASEKRYYEAKEQAERVRYTAEQERFKELQEQARNGSLSLRNRGW